MRWLFDLLYLSAATLTAPIWLVRMARTGKIRTDWPARFGKVTAKLPAKPAARPRVLFHAVSVGEVNAIRELVQRMSGEFDIVIATTTDTGIARARALWADANGGNDAPAAHGGSRPVVVRYPFDFSFAVARFLRAVQPDAVALTELEVWPNFTSACAARGIPVSVINGRLTERSFRRYRLIQRLIRAAFARLSFAAVQNQAYADRFIAMGVPRDRVKVTGTMKWDTAKIGSQVEGADALAGDMRIDRARPLIVAGSTAPGEHELLHGATPPGVQLLCAPRKPEWFAQAAQALGDCIRRTKAQPNAAARDHKPDRFLLDTIGELRMAYALADVVVIGRSFGSLHGSDMMEPAALGKAVVVGPRVSDFQDTVDALLAGDGIVQTTANDLPRVLRELLADGDRREALAANAQRIIRANQGATDRHAALLREMVRRR